MLLFTFLCCSYLANSLTLWKRHSFSLNCFPPHQSKSIQYLCETKLLGIEANSLFFSIILTINLLHIEKKNILIVGSQYSVFPSWDLKLASIHREQGKTEERQGHSRSVGGRLNKKGNLTWVLAWAPTRQVDICIMQDWKVYTVVLTGFRHVFSPDGLNNTLLSQGCILRTVSSVVTVGRCLFQRQGRE